MTEKKKLKVLIADDEAHLRLMFKSMALSMGAEVVGEARNGAEAVDLYHAHKPHITLMDINMPVKTGVDALKEIFQVSPDALVIMLTSVADVKTVEKCLDLGASNYLLKDTPLEEMKKLIKETWDAYRNP